MPLQGWLDAFRTGSLYLLAVSLFLVPVGVGVGSVLIWLWLLAALLLRRPLPSHPAVWLAVAFAVFCLLQAAFPRAGVEPGVRWDAAWSWAQIVAFVPVAYALKGDERLVVRLLLLSLTGLLLGMAWRTDWSLLFDDPQGFADARPGFGFPTLAYALFAGSALIGLFALRRRWWHAASGFRRWWMLLVWLLAVAILAEGFLLSKARGSWLALVLVAVLAAVAWWRQQRRHDRPVFRAGIIAMLAPLLLLLGLNAGEIRERLSEEQQVVGELLRGDLVTDETTSLTLRWHAMLFGWERWLERPWLGWGPGTSRPLMMQSGGPHLRYPEPDGGVLKHLHNSYLELLVQLGLVGLLLWLMVAIQIIWAPYAATRRGELDADLGWFLVLALLYLAFWSHFNFRMVNQDFRGYWTLLAGVSLTFGLYRRRGPRRDLSAP